MTDRDDLNDVKGWGLFLGLLATTLPVTATILLLQSGAYVLLRLWQADVIPGWIDWNYVWHQSLLSLDAIREGRYYTLATCYLFNQDLTHLVFDCAALGYFLGIVERRCGTKWAGALVFLAACTCSAIFCL